MRTLIHISIIILFAIPCFLRAQDRILLLEGRDFECKIISYNDSISWVEKKLKKRTKELVFENTDIFSLNFGDTAEVIFYTPDSELGMTLNTEDMRSFLEGSAFAHRHYSSPWVTAGGFVAGTGGVLFLGFYGLVVPAAYTIVSGLIHPIPKPRSNYNAALFQNDYFVMGYQEVAQKKRVKGAILSSITGIVAVYSYSFIKFLEQ